MVGKLESARAALSPHIGGQHLEACLQALSAAGLLDMTGVGRDGNSRVHAVATDDGPTIIHARVLAVANGELKRLGLSFDKDLRVDVVALTAAMRANAWDPQRRMALKAQLAQLGAID